MAQNATTWLPTSRHDNYDARSHDEQMTQNLTIQSIISPVSSRVLKHNTGKLWRGGCNTVLVPYCPLQTGSKRRCLMCDLGVGSGSTLYTTLPSVLAPRGHFAREQEHPTTYSAKGCPESPTHLNSHWITTSFIIMRMPQKQNDAQCDSDDAEQMTTRITITTTS